MEFTKEQEATQEDVDLCTKRAHEEHRYAAGEPIALGWTPNGRAHVWLHWLADPFWKNTADAQLAWQITEPAPGMRGRDSVQQVWPLSRKAHEERHEKAVAFRYV